MGRKRRCYVCGEEGYYESSSPYGPSSSIVAGVCICDTCESSMITMLDDPDILRVVQILLNLRSRGSTHKHRIESIREFAETKTTA